jgi:hypothetical protein
VLEKAHVEGEENIHFITPSYDKLLLLNLYSTGIEDLNPYIMVLLVRL